MSEDTNNPTPANEPEKTPADSSLRKTKAKKPKQPGRWKKRFVRLAVVLLVLAVAMRLAIIYLLPKVLNKVASTYDLSITYDRHELALLGGDVGIWGLKVAPRVEDGAESPALFQADYVRGDVSVWELVKGRLHALRLEADGVQMNLERTADGRIPALEKLLAPKPAQPAPKTEDSGKPIQLESPLQIDALRLSKIHANIRDAAVNPPVAATIDMNVRLSFVRWDRPAQFEIDVWCDPALDSLQIRGEGAASGGRADLRARVALRGLHAKPLAGYLEPFGWRPAADGISGEMSATAHIEAVPAPAPVGTIKAELVLDALQFRADGQNVATLKQVRVLADPVNATSAKIAEVVVEGGRLNAGRDEQGALDVAGFHAIPVAASQRPSVRAAAAAAAAPTTKPATPFDLTIGQIIVRDVAATLRDRAVEPPAELTAAIEELTATAKPAAPDAANVPLDIRGRMALPGIARAATVEGSLSLGGGITADLSFGAEGIKPDALRPYLAPTGVQPLLKSGKLQGKLTAAVVQESGGAVTADVRLGDIQLADGDELLAMPAIQIQGARVDGGIIVVKAIDLEGPVFAVQRDAEGSVTAGGMRIGQPAARPGLSPSPGTPGEGVGRGVQSNASQPATRPATQPSSLPRLDIGRLTWRGVKIKLIDQQTQPPSVVEIADVGLELKDLLLDLAAKDAAPRKGHVDIWLKSPQLSKSVTLAATLTPQPSAIAADLKLDGKGIDLRPLAPYLKPFGIEPILADGQMQGNLSATVSADDAGRLSGQVNLTDLSLKDGGDELAGIEKLSIKDARLDGAAASVDKVQIDRPRASVLRRADGTLVAAGIHLLPATQPAARRTADLGRPGSGEVARPTSTPATAPAPAMTFALGSFDLKDARLNWTDEAMPRGVQMQINVNATTGQLLVGKPAPATPVDLTVAIKDVLDELSVKGTVTASPDSPAAKLTVAARGLRAGPAAAYLPPGVESSLKDGRLNVSIDAGLEPNKEGGQSARLLVRDLNWRDGENAPLVRLDAFTLKAPRVDAAGDVFAIDEISLAGLQADAVRLADGATSAAGVILRPVAPAAPKPAPAPAGPPATQPAPPAPAAQPAPDMAQLVAAARKPLPLVTIKTLDLGFKRVAFRDESRPGSAPIALVDANFRNLGPIELGGADAATRPPTRLQFVGQVEPVIGKFDLATEVAPFATEPGLELKLALTGITGEGLLKLSPELAEQIDASKLTDGRFAMHLQSHASFARRGPRDLDLQRGFDLDFSLQKVEFRNGEAGPVLAGVESVQSDKIHVEPKTGRVHIKSLEITKPVAQIVKDATGMHVAGLVIKAEPAPTTAPAEAPSAGTASSNAKAPSPQPSPGAPGEGEIRIDRLLVSGLDFRFEDRTVNPPLIVPLNELDVEARDLTSLAASQDRPVRFSVAVGAGKVPLPVRKGGAMEERDLFSQVTASGTLSLYPAPHGRVKTAVNGLDLVAFSSTAAQKGVKLGAGYFDGNVDVRLEHGSIDARTKLVVTDLSLADSPDGFLKKAMVLPAPLDIVIGALEDPDGSITVPLNVPVEDGKLSTGAVVASASGAFLQIVGVALASAPVKIVGGFIPKGPKGSNEAETVVVSFAPGSATLDDSQRQKLNQLIERAGKDKNLQMMIRHELGGADVSAAAIRSNPTPEDALALAGRLRTRRAELIEQRSSLSAQARAQLAGGAVPARVDETLRNLRAVNTEIGSIEQSLDQLYDLLRPGASRQADRRTRSGALEIAQHRLDAVKAVLDGAKIENAKDRVRTEASRFNPAENQSPGQITITLTTKKRA